MLDLAAGGTPSNLGRISGDAGQYPSSVRRKKKVLTVFFL
jgi:hypothetical protein